MGDLAVRLNQFDVVEFLRTTVDEGCKFPIT